MSLLQIRTSAKAQFGYRSYKEHTCRPSELKVVMPPKTTATTERRQSTDPDVSRKKHSVPSGRHPHGKEGKSGYGRKPFPHPLEELLGETVKNAKGVTTSPRIFSVDDGVIGLYFSAQWCPPCKILTERLILLYTETRKDGKSLEIIFISFDATDESFVQYFSGMPWWAVNFDDEEKRDEIAMKYGIKGIPVLMFLDAKSLDVITLNGRDIVMTDPKGALFPWKSVPEAPTPESSPQISPVKPAPPASDGKGNSKSVVGKDVAKTVTDREAAKTFKERGSRRSDAEKEAARAVVAEKEAARAVVAEKEAARAVVAEREATKSVPEKETRRSGAEKDVGQSRVERGATPRTSAVKDA